MIFWKNVLKRWTCIEIGDTNSWWWDYISSTIDSQLVYIVEEFICPTFSIAKRLIIGVAIDYYHYSE